MWLKNAVKNWMRRRRVDAELDEEVRSYAEMLADEKVRKGVNAQRARREARTELGGVEQVKEQTREVRAGHFLETLWQDVRYGARMLRRNPGFTFIAVITLALGIGANTAIFSAVNAVMLRPLPFRNASQLMVVWHTPPQKSFPGVHRFVVSPANYLDWQSENHSFAQMSAIGFSRFKVTGLTQPESVQGRRVSSDFFSLLGVSPIAGRGFVAADDQPGRGNIVVLGYAFCQSHLGTPQNALGKTIQLDDQSYTVIGVMPPRFDFPFQAQMWKPLAWTDKDRAVRGNHNYIVIARLKSGVDERKAQAEMSAISSRLAQQYPVDDAGWGALVLPVRELVAGSVGPALLVLFGAVGFVLLIACTNVANLILAKSLGRRKEIAIRTVLGASRGRVMRQVLVESLLLAVAGGALALVIARFAIDAIAAFLVSQLPLTIQVGLDGSVLAFTLAISILTGVIAGVAPAWHLTKTNLNESLKQGLGKTSADSGGNRARNVLIVSEVALCLVLLAGAGLTMRSLFLLRSVNAGIDPHNVLTVELVISKARYPGASQQTNFFESTLQRVRALPGVLSAADVDSPPFEGGSTEPVQVEGQPVVPMADQPEVALRMISPGYLTTMRIPLVQGRDFTEEDKKGSQRVILVSRSFAKRFWPHENPIGKHVALTFSSGPAFTVAGVVGDVRLNGLDITQPVQAVYRPMLQNSETLGMALAVRTGSHPRSLTSAVVDAVHEVDPYEPVANIVTMDELVDQSLAQYQLNMILLGTFAALALLLAAVGIYGVQAYAVRHRAREIGIRMALGARPSDVFRLIVGQGMKLALIGIGAGLTAALALTRLMASQIYGLSAMDPLTFAGVTIVLALIALVACYVPARRATKVDPVTVLNDE